MIIDYTTKPVTGKRRTTELQETFLIFLIIQIN